MRTVRTMGIVEIDAYDKIGAIPKFHLFVDNALIPTNYRNYITDKTDTPDAEVKKSDTYLSLALLEHSANHLFNASLLSSEGASNGVLSRLEFYIMKALLVLITGF